MDITNEYKPVSCDNKRVRTSVLLTMNYHWNDYPCSHVGGC